MRYIFVLVSALTAQVLGCSLSEEAPADARPSTTQDEEKGSFHGGDEKPANSDNASVGTLTWSSCSLIEGANDSLAECAELLVPRVWGENDDETFAIRAKRVQQGPETETQVWLLAGGPGASGTILHARLVQQLLPFFPSVDFYMIDARGTGFSNYLACPLQEQPGSEADAELTANEVAACAHFIQQGNPLHAFGITQSAHDLIAYVEATRRAGQRVALWAQSAGTLWAQRALLLDPQFVDAVVLEAPVSPRFSFKLQDSAAAEALYDLLSLCSQDESCAERYPSPIERTAALWPRLRQGHCSAVPYSVEELQHLLFLMLPSYPLNAAIPAFLFHLDRCSREDIAMLDVMFQAIDRKLVTGRTFSQALFQLVAASELWRHPAFPSEQSYIEHLDHLYEQSLLGTGSAGHAFAAKLNAWPQYEDPLVGQWPETSVAMLMLHGALDPLSAAASAEEVKARYSRPGQTYVDFAYTPHTVVGSTPTNEGQDCALSLVSQFLNAPAVALETQCAEQTLPPNFVGDDFAPLMFGSQDYWRAPGGMIQPASHGEAL